MRTAGFPCRVLGCEHVVQVMDQNSMDALQAGSAARSEHEVSIHDYHHVRISEDSSHKPWSRPKAVSPVGRPGTGGH